MAIRNAPTTFKLGKSFKAPGKASMPVMATKTIPARMPVVATPAVPPKRTMAKFVSAPAKMVTGAKKVTEAKKSAPVKSKPKLSIPMKTKVIPTRRGMLSKDLQKRYTRSV